MELCCEPFRAMIYDDFNRNLSAAESLTNLTVVFGEQVPSRATVYNWFAEFRHGRAFLEDKQRLGRPGSVVHEEKVAAVQKMVKADSRVTCHQIVVPLDVSSSSLNKDLHDHLQLRKLSARWIPHPLTEDQKQKRIDFCKFMLTAELRSSLGRDVDLSMTPRPSVSPNSGSLPEEVRRKRASALEHWKANGGQILL